MVLAIKPHINLHHWTDVWMLTFDTQPMICHFTLRKICVTYLMYWMLTPDCYTLETQTRFSYFFLLPYASYSSRNLCLEIDSLSFFIKPSDFQLIFLASLAKSLVAALSLVSFLRFLNLSFQMLP